MKESKKIIISRNCKEKGITLIALVTTIVILLILAGVTISQITGNGGLFSKTKKEVNKYEEAGDDEAMYLQQLSRYMLDFSIVGDSDATVKIKSMQIDAISTESIKVTVSIEGTASKIEYSIDNGENWKTGENQTSKECTFDGLKAGSYFIRVKAYDGSNKYTEAISKVITIGEITTAGVGDVLNGKTFWRNGEIKNGSMANNGAINTNPLSAGESYKIPAGYHNGNGTVTTKDLKSQTPGNAKAEDIATGKEAWVNGSLIKGNAVNKVTYEGVMDYVLGDLTCVASNGSGATSCSVRVPEGTTSGYLVVCATSFVTPTLSISGDGLASSEKICEWKACQGDNANNHVINIYRCRFVENKTISVTVSSGFANGDCGTSAIILSGDVNNLMGSESSGVGGTSTSVTVPSNLKEGYMIVCASSHEVPLLSVSGYGVMSASLIGSCQPQNSSGNNHIINIYYCLFNPNHGITVSMSANSAHHSTSIALLSK